MLWMHKAQAGLHTMHVLWGVILLECCLWARGARGAQAMGLPPQSSTCRDSLVSPGALGWLVCGGQREVPPQCSGSDGLPGQAQPEQLNSRDGEGKRHLVSSWDHGATEFFRLEKTFKILMSNQPFNHHHITSRDSHTTHPPRETQQNPEHSPLCICLGLQFRM